MDNPPSTTSPTRHSRRVLVTGAAALAAAGCIGLSAASGASTDPLVPSARYVRNDVRSVHTQTAARPVVFDPGPTVGLSDIRTVAVTVPVTVAAPVTTAPTTPPTTAPKAVKAPPTTAAPVPTTAATAPPTTAAPARRGADPGDPATWDRLAQCESGGNWATNTGNGYYGGLQFSASSWRAVGGSGLPHQASRETQIEMGKRLQARAGWSQWPACTRKLGYR
jgi:hypothetical protein